MWVGGCTGYGAGLVGRGACVGWLQGRLTHGCCSSNACCCVASGTGPFSTPTCPPAQPTTPYPAPTHPHAPCRSALLGIQPAGWAGELGAQPDCAGLLHLYRGGQGRDQPPQVRFLVSLSARAYWMQHTFTVVVFYLRTQRGSMTQLSSAPHIPPHPPTRTQEGQARGETARETPPTPNPHPCCSFNTSKRVVDEMVVSLARCIRPKLCIVADVALGRRKRPSSTPATFCSFDAIAPEAMELVEG